MMSFKLHLPAWVKDLGAVTLVSVGVAVVFTVAASVFDQFHQVAAEDVGGNEVAAVVGSDHTQVLKVDQWGITLTLPLGSDMSTIKYATQGPDSIGLTSEGVEKIDSVCTAEANAVGVVVREPAGAHSSNSPVQGQASLGTIGNYEYTYERPDSACEATQASEFASQESIGIAGAAVLGAQ